MKSNLFFVFLLLIIFSNSMAFSNSFEKNYHLDNMTNLSISFSFKIDKNSITFTPYSILKDIEYYNTDSSFKALAVFYITLVILVPIGGCLIIAGIPLLAIGGYNNYYNMDEYNTIPFFASGGASLGLGHALLLPTMISGIIIGATL